MPIVLEWLIEQPADAAPPAASFSATMQDRILMFTRGERFKGLVGVFADRTSALLDLCDEIVAAFDVTTATGDRLDKLGSILQRPRLGMSDDLYRRVLQIQIEIILSSTASTPSILRIVELYTGLAPVSYQEHYPMGFQVGAIVDPDETALLLQLIADAKAAAYGATVVAMSADDLIVDYTPASPVTGAGVVDYTPASPVTGADPTSYPHVI